MIGWNPSSKQNSYNPVKRHSSPLWLKYLPVTTTFGGAVFGWLLFLFGSYLFIGAVTKTLAVLIGSAWVALMAFATKVADITESPALTTDEHQRLEKKCRQAVRRIWALSAVNAVAVILVLIPASLIDGKAPVFEWLVILSGIAGGFSVYSIVLNARWQEELRIFRSDLRLREREKTRLAEQKALFATAGKDTQDNLAADVAKHNRVFDWPVDPSSSPH